MNRFALVLDASVVVEYLVELKLARQATALFRQVLTDADLELWAPDLVYVECASALRRLVRAKALSRGDGRACVDRLLRLPLTIAKSQIVVADAFALGDAFTVCDATYAALAQRLDCALVTADAKLGRALRSRRRLVKLLSDL